MTSRLLIGGTFNPVHRGHLALAERARDALGFDRVELVPCHTPFHRSGDALLPFELRCDLIRRAVAGIDRLDVNDIEARLPKPSLTWRTVAALSVAAPQADLHFALGQREFLRLHKWVKGREVAAAAHMVVAPRGDFDARRFEAELLDAWPGARPVTPPAGSAAAWEILPGRRAVLLDLAPVAVSATMVREGWRNGGDIRHLVPDAVRSGLEDRRGDVDRIWARAGD